MEGTKLQMYHVPRFVKRQEDGLIIGLIIHSRGSRSIHIYLPGTVHIQQLFGFNLSVCNVTSDQHSYDAHVLSLCPSGVSPLGGCGGWWLERRGPAFCAVYDGSRETLRTVPPQVKTLGVFLNVGGGALSFHNPLTREHLATLPTRFDPAGVLPALGLGQGRLRLRCGLPPPPHVFLGKDSDYRGPGVAGGGRWCRDVPFQSVKRVIRKFEELAVPDSGSGPVSGFGSSCSSWASLSDLGTGTFPRGGGRGTGMRNSSMGSLETHSSSRGGV